MQIVSIKNLFSGKYKKNISKCLLKKLPIALGINLFSLIMRNPVFGVTTRYEIDQTAQLQRKTSLEKLDTLYLLSSEQEMNVLIRLCRCNRLICAFDVCKGIKQVFL